MDRVKELFGLSGRLIVVAGGGGQIGFEMVKILADAGAKIIIADIDREMAEDKLGKSNIGSKVEVMQLDVSDGNRVTQFAQEVHEKHGTIYGLVNCFHFKGNTRELDNQSNFFSDFADYPEEAWDLVHDVNLKGSFLLSQAILPYFDQTTGGVIVNISSTYGNVSANKSIYGNSGINSPVAYGTSKGALISLTRYMATHLADRRIRVNCLSPGGVYNNQPDDFRRNYENLTPMGRMARAEEYQGPILFLMSEASSYMTGANLVVDGGWTAW